MFEWGKSRRFSLQQHCRASGVGSRIAGRRRRPANAMLAAILPAACVMMGGQRLYAGSATWSATPVSSDWLNPNNWSASTVPNGSSDVASFGVSTQTTVNNTQTSVLITLDGITFNAAASTYTITGVAGGGFFITGTGVVNNSGIMQNFVPALQGGSTRITAGILQLATNNALPITTALTVSGGPTPPTP